MKNYISTIFQGRLSRLQYVLARIYYGLIFFLLIVLTLLPLILLGTAIDSTESVTSPAQYGLITASVLAVLLWYVVSAIIEVSLMIRRLHDMNISWWPIVFAVIPVVNVLFGVYILFMPGTNGINDYGKRPKGYNWRTLLKIPKKP